LGLQSPNATPHAGKQRSRQNLISGQISAARERPLSAKTGLRSSFCAEREQWEHRSPVASVSPILACDMFIFDSNEERQAL
jgi:hypothetical protein